MSEGKRYELRRGDCLRIMRTLDEDSVDAIVSDPPYGLSFMGKEWDRGVPGEAFWVEALRVAKPGAHLLAFGGTRTFHRLAVAIEDAGWELRDTIGWMYGSGFPKSHNVSKAMDREAGEDREYIGEGPYSSRKPRPYEGGNALMISKSDAREGNPITAPATAEAEQWSGWGTALKPAWEPIIVARKPLVGTVAQNVLEYGTGGLNIDGCRVGTDEHGASREHKGRVYDGVSEGYQRPNKSSYTHKTDWHMQPNGRWPANLIHDGSEEVVDCFPSEGRSTKASNGGRVQYGGAIWGSTKDNYENTAIYKDEGTAARFFYCAKASKEDRDEGCGGVEPKVADAHNLSSNACARCGLRVKANGSGVKCECGDLRETIKLPPSRNHHPTVKPTDLMRYLCRLVTPPDGLILDPFMGSGSTGKGAILEGFRFVGIDITPEYVQIADARLAWAERQWRNRNDEFVILEKEKQAGKVSLFDWAGGAHE